MNSLLSTTLAVVLTISFLTAAGAAESAKTPAAALGDEWQVPPRPAPQDLVVPAGPFASEWKSLENYRVPDWYRDAKLGIFVHWGPQTLASVSGSADGSRSPWKDLARAFQGEQFDANHWAKMFQRAGAKYVVQVYVREARRMKSSYVVTQKDVDGKTDPVWMILDESAGVAASLALKQRRPVQNIDYPELRSRLQNLRQILERPA